MAPVAIRFAGIALFIVAMLVVISGVMNKDIVVALVGAAVALVIFTVWKNHPG